MLFILLVLLMLCGITLTSDGVKKDGFFTGLIGLVMMFDIIAIAIRMILLLI